MLCFSSLDMFFLFLFDYFQTKLFWFPFHMSSTRVQTGIDILYYSFGMIIYFEIKKWLTMIYQPILPPTCIVHGRPPPKVSSMFQNKVYSWSKPVRLDLSSTIPMISEGLIWSLERRLIGAFSNTKARLVQLGTENFDDSTWIGTSDILSPE